MIRLLVFLLFLALPARAEDELRLSAELTAPDAAPYTGEMVMLTIRGAYKVPITLENLVQPDLDGFGWMQLGEDRWFESTERGQRVVNLERRMALFPERAGTLTVGPFRHELTLSKPTGERYVQHVDSEPVTLTVAAPPESEDWWFPVGKIHVADDWSNAPQSLAPGESALRKVTVSVDGVQPEMIPPMPEMRGAGVAILPHPEVRRTLLRPRGPVTQAFWRWTIRPEGPVSGFVDPVRLAYFDSSAREARSITLSAQRIAFAGAEGKARRDDAPEKASIAAGDPGLSLSFAWLWPLGGVAGLAAGWAALLRGTRLGSLERPESLIARLRLWYAALRKDAVAARRAAHALIRADIAAGRYGQQEAARFESAFAPLDRSLYGAAEASVDPRTFRRSFLSERARLTEVAARLHTRPRARPMDAKS